jgi:phosphatidylglycerol:prolipoprotein diacylglycerol transferase
LSVFDHSDAIVVALAFGIFLSRIGCFLNGCCFGSPTDSFVGMVFPQDSPAGWAFPGIHIHPAQLYASGFGLLLFFVLRWVNRHRRFSGQAMALFFMLEAVFRFLLEFVRHYEEEMTLGAGQGGWTYNQMIALALFLFGAGVYFIRRRKTPAALTQNTEGVPRQPE